MKRQDLGTYIERTYGVIGECLFAKDPATCVFRHKGNRKWFAIIMHIPKQKLGLTDAGSMDVVNFKCDPRLIGSFREEKGIYPAYHMSKAHWLTVALDDSVPKETLYFLLQMSFDLTGGTKG